MNWDDDWSCYGLPEIKLTDAIKALLPFILFFGFVLWVIL